MSKSGLHSVVAFVAWDPEYPNRPSLPVFVSPNVHSVLVKTFNIKPITTPKEDLAAILGPTKG